MSNLALDSMIIDFDTSSNSTHTCQRVLADNQFATVLAQYAMPLFAPWPAAEQNLRPNAPLSSLELNTHPATSNRREGRHARG